MNTPRSALIVSAQDGLCLPLESCLESGSVRTVRARTCDEARNLLRQHDLQVVFSDTALPDGSWMDVLNLAAESPDHVRVIVVSRLDDVKLYLEAIERGAFDFMSFPLRPSDVAFVFQRASTPDLQSPAAGRRMGASA